MCPEALRENKCVHGDLRWVFGRDGLLKIEALIDGDGFEVGGTSDNETRFMRVKWLLVDKTCNI